MRRRATMVLLVAPIALVLSGPAEGRRASGCERLRGGDLAPARAVKLVMRANQYRGADLVGCALPRGRVRTFATSAELETVRRRFDILQVAGAFVLLRSQGSTQSANAETVSVSHISSGDSYEIAYRCAQLGGGDCGRAGRSSMALKAFVNEQGRAFAALIFAGSGATTISGFSRLGERRDFDSGLPAEIPVTAMKLYGNRASWTNGGRTYSAQLPE